MTTQTKSAQSLSSYDRMARWYDAFTHNHDYVLWHSALIPALERSGLRGHRLLDVGCGTGKSFLPLASNSSWRITASELSPKMAAIARQKAPHVPVHVADLRAFPTLGEFDVVWALSDVLNYMQDGSELSEALSGMARNLGPGGLILFDLNTLHTYRTFYAETEAELIDGALLTWRGTAPPDMDAGELATAFFEVAGPATPASLHISVPHTQRHFPVPEVIEAIDAAGLECVASFGQGFDAVLHDELNEAVHTKFVFIARRHEGR